MDNRSALDVSGDIRELREIARCSQPQVEEALLGIADRLAGHFDAAEQHVKILREQVATEYCRGRDHEARARADAAKPIEPFRSSNPTMHDLLTAFGQAYHKLLVFGASYASEVEAAQEAIIARTARETTARHTDHSIPCPTCGSYDLPERRAEKSEAKPGWDANGSES